MLINFNHLKTFYNALVQKLKSFRGNWEQNDPSADDYIKNRPFYSEVKNNVILLPEAKIQIMEGDNCIGLDAPINLIEGQAYTVICDDVEYQCVCWYYDDWEALCLGNGSILDSSNTQGNGEPFCLDSYEGGDTYFNANNTNPHIISILGKKEVVHKLDKKFIDIPDNLVTSDDLAAVAVSGSYYDLSNKPTIYSDVVRYDSSQSLTTTQKTRARSNIGAGTSNFSGSYNDLTNRPTIHTDVVRYDVTQNLTDSNKTLARANIGAAGTEDIANLKDEIYETKSDVYTKTWNGVLDGITDTFTTDKYTMPFYKIDDIVIPFDYIDSASVSLGGEAYGYFNYYVNGVGCYAIGGSGAQPFVIVVTAAGNCSVKLTYQGVSASYTFTAPSTGVYAYCIYRTETNAQYAKSVTINYTNKQYQLNLNGYKVGVEADGALSTTDSNGNVVTMAKNTVYKISTISLPASGWTEATNVYSQVVSVTGATANSQVDLYPTPEQLIDMQISGISLVAVNEDGVVTVYALNNKPTSDYSMQVTLTEVNEGV